MTDPRHATPTRRRWSYQDATEYLYGRIDYERAAGPAPKHTFRLERTEELFQQLGLGDYLHRPVIADRQQQNCETAKPKVPLVHLAGTKGKGSTAAMVSEILTTAGYRVGLYTSPHLTDLEERFRINGVACSPAELIDLVQSVAPVADALDGADRTISFFELTTAMAVLHFDRSGCDAIVLETGLGGRLDSTNVCASTVAAITSIGLDHQRVLGNTFEAIAAEKAGIIKGGVPVVSGVLRAGAAEVVRHAARLAGSVLWQSGVDFSVLHQHPTAVGNAFTFQAIAAELRASPFASELAVELALDGAHQVHNATLAIAIARLLCSDQVAAPLQINDTHIVNALRTVRCSGRMERFWFETCTEAAGKAQLILDASHNEDSIGALCQAVQRRLGEDQAAKEPGTLHRPIVVVFGTSRDKDVAPMAAKLLSIADRIYCTRYTTNPRAVPIEQLMNAFAQASDLARPIPIEPEPDPQQALRAAIDAVSSGGTVSGGTVIVCGSFFLAGELRPTLLAMPQCQPMQREDMQFSSKLNHGREQPFEVAPQHSFSACAAVNSKDPIMHPTPPNTNIGGTRSE